MKTITLKNQRPIDRNSISVYFKLKTNPHLGVRVYGKGFKSKHSALKSFDLFLCEQEVENGRSLKGKPLFSQIHLLVLVSYKDKFYPGVISENFLSSGQDRDLFSLTVDKNGKWSFDDGQDLYTVIDEVFKSNGIIFSNLPDRRVRVTPGGKIKFTDLSPKELDEDFYDQEEDSQFEILQLLK